jgi:hypothetical protein
VEDATPPSLPLLLTRPPAVTLNASSTIHLQVCVFACHRYAGACGASIHMVIMVQCVCKPGCSFVWPLSIVVQTMEASPIPPLFEWTLVGTALSGNGTVLVDAAGSVGSVFGSEPGLWVASLDLAALLVPNAR